MITKQAPDFRYKIELHFQLNNIHILYMYVKHAVGPHKHEQQEKAQQTDTNSIELNVDMDVSKKICEK